MGNVLVATSHAKPQLRGTHLRFDLASGERRGAGRASCRLCGDLTLAWCCEIQDFGVVLERSRTCEIHERTRRRVRACWVSIGRAPVLTGIAAVSGTDTASRSSETPPEPYEDRAKAEQPRPITAVKKMHSSFVEQNVPKRKPERSGGDVGAALMLPSSAGMMRAFTSVLFSDMLLIEFTRTYDRGRWMAGV